MKRILRLGIVFLLALFIGPSCELLDDCKSCKYVTYENGSLTSEGSEVEYCGEELADIEDEDPVEVGEMRSEWQCW